ncbi:hypothetical protein CA13_08640 [Planctomycetes bacterium CA13]|uniref:Uncharacterized protein n=1 Tax=Novipirellula herctigrandis TaxID=2527986 RepID=A0A5C5YY97_9BACT|nr:hypothetical protein CA13_08640 [Planctomycetes bacterium CA13]
MANREELNWTDRHRGNHVLAIGEYANRIRSVVLFFLLFVAAFLPSLAAESQTTKGISRRVTLDGPGNSGAIPCDVVQVLDPGGNLREYFMDVDSVVCADAKCEIVTVRIHFDPLGNYLQYEIPSGGNLTKWGHQPFSRADHNRLHQILLDPYSQLKSIGWDQITMPKSAATGSDASDGISGATMLSKKSVVVVGAAYTCCTLWHWSHGEVENVIRNMTADACGKQDLIQYLRSGREKYVVFAANQLQMQRRFDTETLSAVVQIMRQGDAKLVDSALEYLEKASAESGIDFFFRCSVEESLLTDSTKRVRFLEALRDSTQKFPAGYLDQFSGWLGRADSYYEVHLLLSLLEQQSPPTDEAVNEAILLLRSRNSLVVRRSYKYLNSMELTASQQRKFDSFEQ